ncbi:MAG: TetR/AcrR family transcriptional regulator [Chitinispirillia bacterium]|jgi:AcrR family transcriptional regulator
MNPIQEERIKGYFINAAQEIIRGEGVGVVSARNVAERAGYSYATLYNYFKDIRDLIFSCIEGFLKECKDFIESQTCGIKSGEERLMAIIENYVRFFIQYPGIFDLLFQQKAGSISTDRSNFNTIYSFFDSLTDKDWDKCVEKNIISQEDRKEKQEQFKLSIHGLLLFYLNNRIECSYKELIDRVNKLNMIY